MATRRHLRWASRRFRADERGAAMVEFTITLPFLLAMCALVAEGGRILWHHELIAKGVREATRYLSRVDDPTDATAQAQAVNLALRGRLTGGTPKLALWNDAATVVPTVTTIDNSAGAFRGPAEIQVVTVTATVLLDYPFAAVLRFFDPAIPTEFTITAADSARHYGE
jgi:Flp pilus assembly protein TadG